MRGRLYHPYLAFHPKVTLQCRCRDENNYEFLVERAVKNTRIP